MLKAEDNPPIVHPAVDSLGELAGQWWVAHTKARSEKSLAWSLYRWGVGYFLPLREKVTARRGRKYKSLLPLFPGYVFFNGDEESRYQALTTNRIAQVIEVVDQDQLVRELDQIHRALSAGAPLDPHPYLKSGARCRVKAGPLADMEGMVVRRKGVTKLILRVDILGQAAAVEIEGDLLESLD